MEQVSQFRYLGSLISEDGYAQKKFAAELRWRRKCLEKRKLFSGKSESGTKEENNEMLGLECSTVCSRDVDVGADRQKKMRSL